MLAATGNLFRLRHSVGEPRSMGVWRAADEDELHQKMLGTLPRSWMTLTVTSLESHPNDPGQAEVMTTAGTVFHRITARRETP